MADRRLDKATRGKNPRFLSEERIQAVRERAEGALAPVPALSAPIAPIVDLHPREEDRREREILTQFDPGFELFTKQGPKNTLLPVVSIRANATLSLNTTALETMGDPDHVELLYSKSTRVIGIRPCKELTQHSRLLTDEERTNHRLVSLVGFLRQYGLEKVMPRTYQLQAFPGGIWGFAPEIGTEVLRVLHPRRSVAYRGRRQIE